MKKPNDSRLYSKTHEWILIQGDRAKIGVTDHAQSELGDIVYVDLPNPGRTLKAGDIFGSLESVKTVSDLYTPIDGIVTEINDNLKGHSEWVNEDPFETGWMIELNCENPDTTSLMDWDAYEKFVKEH